MKASTVAFTRAVPGGTQRGIQSGFKSLIMSIVALVLLFGAGPVMGAELRWDGGHGNWSVAANWDPNAVPSDGDTLVFPYQGLAANTVNDMVGLDLEAIRISSNMDLSGNAVGVSSNIFVFTSSPIPQPMTIDMDIVLNGDVTITAYANSFANSTLNIYGDIDTGTHTLRVGDSGIHTGAPVYLYGSVSGSGSVIKFGDGTVYLAGSSGNTCTGTTTVEEGTLVLDKDTGNAVQGSLIIGGNDTSDPTATVLQQSLAEIGVNVTINRQGTYDMNGYNESIFNLNLNGGADINTGTATLTLFDDVTVSGGFSTIDGKLSLSSGNCDFNILYSVPLIFPYAHCYLDADVSGLGNLIKKGSGFMRITGNNTYSGTTVVEDGMIQIESDTALGTTAGGTTVNAGAKIYMSVVSQGSSQHIIGETLSLGGGINSYGVSNSWTGAITLTGDATILVASGDYLNLSGVISGTGGMTKHSSGTLIFSGSTANSYSGSTVVSGGTLLLDKAGFNAIRYGSLTIGDGAGSADEVVVRALRNYQIGDNVPITINADGYLDVDAYIDTVGAITINGGGHAGSSTGTLKLGGNLTVNGGDSSADIDGYFYIGSATRTFTINDGATGYELRIFAVVSGGGNIVKAGGGNLALYGANTYTGSTTVNDGGIYVRNAAALGTVDGGTTATGSGFVYLVGQNVVGEMLTLDVPEANGTVLYASSTSSWSGDIVLDEDARVYTSGTLGISGAVSGSGDLIKIGAGTLTFSGSTHNTHADTYVNSGTLELGKSSYNVTIPGNLYIGDGAGADVVRLLVTSQIANSSRITIAGSGLFDMNNLTELIGSLDGSGSVTMGIGNLRTGSDNTSSTFSGVIDGSGYVQKNGSGTFTLGGNNTYSGITQVQGGTLLVNGSQPSSDVTVYSAGTLGGIGTVGAVSSSGTVAPGNSAGQLGSGSATLNSGSFDVELNGNTLVGYDQLDVGGSVSLGNANLNISWGYTPAEGDSFMIIDNDGVDAVSGTFNGYAEGASIVVGDVTLEISYLGGTGNDVVLEATDVPVEDLVITSITAVGGNIELEWVGGTPSYQIEKKESLTNASWTVVYGPTSGMTGSVPADTTNGFYRVTGGH